MTRILAIDTAMNGCGAALYRAEQEKCFARTRPMVRGHAEHLVPMVQEVMDEFGIAYADLDAVLTTIGPGAFTGLRIGLSAARTFSLSLDIPVYGITTLQALALKYAEDKTPAAPFTVLVETKRVDFYLQSFDAQGRPLGEELSLMAEDIEALPETIFIGDAIAHYRELVPRSKHKFVEGYDLPDTSVMAKNFFKDKSLFTPNPEPLYLRGPDVSQPKTPQRKIEGVAKL